MGHLSGVGAVRGRRAIREKRAIQENAVIRDRPYLSDCPGRGISVNVLLGMWRDLVSNVGNVAGLRDAGREFLHGCTCPMHFSHAFAGGTNVRANGQTPAPSFCEGNGGQCAVGRRGLEPRTYGLKVRSSTIELATRGFHS